MKMMGGKKDKKNPDKIGLDVALSKLKLPRPGWYLLSITLCLFLSLYVFDSFKKAENPLSSAIIETKDSVVPVVEKSNVANNEKHVHDVEHDHNCFCQLHGAINDDCSCQVDAVDQYNNFKVYPRMVSLLQKNYFRYIQVNLKKDCPFWHDDSTCSFEFCQVKACGENEVPAGIKGQRVVTHPVLAQKKKTDEVAGCSTPEDLGYINMTLSAESMQGFERWKTYDEGLTDFCSVSDDEGDSELDYVDLLLNPERFTGYSGPSAHRVWSSIYNENCFKEVNGILDPFGVAKNDTCIEKRTFYRAISGLHSSINIHLSYKYLLSRSPVSSPFSPKNDLIWGPNVTEFKQHFQITKSDNQAHAWLKNLYFLYLLELKAIAKVSPFLEQFEFYTGDSTDDADMKLAIRDLLKVVEGFPYHFEETALFSTKDAVQLKKEFHDRFTNITKIMDCVGCQKCKLWGKVQIKGLGTALKILFSERFKHSKKNPVFLARNEIVSLFNAFGRLSESIHALGKFRYLIEQEEKSGTGSSSSRVKKRPIKFPF